MLKSNLLKYLSVLLFAIIIVACSTKKDTLVTRNWHALNTEYNTLYNGGVALEAGINEVKTTYKDNFWEILPVERMQIENDAELPGQKGKNKNFERAEEKATKAIQKHSMNIEGKERNMQMDEAHLMLGQARYYDKRFVPALEAFNYILYKYSNSDKIYEAKVWREKTNLRLENDALAIKNLRLLLKKQKLKSQIQADANAVLAQAFINLEQKDSAVAPLKIALEKTKWKEEKARYHFILGQLYESLQHKDSAYAQFQEVIEMKRKSPRLYVMQAHAMQAKLADFTKDTVAFLKKYDKLFKDRENRPYHDILNFQMAMFYDKLENKNKAIKFYNKSLRSRSEDNYLQATTYKNLATIYFDKTKYVLAGEYYDSTLTKLVKKNKEFFVIQKKRQNLDDVIKYEGIVKTNDSILKITAMSDQDKTKFYEEYIAKLKAQELAQKEKEAKQKQLDAAKSGIQDIKTDNLGISPPSSLTPPVTDNFSQQSKFYFYNPTVVSLGKVEFRKKWGKRSLNDNWRWSSQSNDAVVTENNSVVDTTKTIDNSIVEERFTTDFYLKQLPTDQKLLDSLARERNIANYELGVIYKEKFQENKLAASKFETLLGSKPEERLILPSYYNLFKIYEILHKNKAEEYKNKIITNYPTTRYAQILNGTIIEGNTTDKTPDQEYKEVFSLFKNQDYSNTINCIDEVLGQFSGNDIVPKLEFLKASALGKLKGVDEYKKALNYIVVTYPNTEESKQADELLKTSVPFMEQMAISLDTVSSKSWKVLYSVGAKNEVSTQQLIEKIKQYLKEKQYDTFSISYDVYNEKENFVVVHGISSREYALYLIDLLKTTKDYKIKTKACVISTENYSTVQIKKNLDLFLNLKI